VAESNVGDVRSRADRAPRSTISRAWEIGRISLRREQRRRRNLRTMSYRIATIFAGLSAMLFLSFAVPALAKKTPPKHPIDINLAGAKELEELPGVGPTTAKAIIQFREKTGRFRRVEDLLAIRGISETKLAKMRPYIMVGPPAKKSPPAPPNH
jgi:competence ComEA-like helix-hairpin-helix protein